MILTSFVFGVKLKSMWGFPCAYLLGVLMFAFLPCKLTDVLKKKIYLGVYVIMALMLMAQMMIILLNKSDKFQLDAKAFGQTVEELWYQKNGRVPLEYVAGDVWWANNAALFAPSRPKPIIWGDLKQNPWFDANDVANKGALILTSGEGEYNALRKKMMFVSSPQILEVEVQNRVGKKKTKRVYYGFYNVSGDK